MANIRRVEPDDWEVLKAVRLAALADAPYAFGSTHAEEVQFDEPEWRRRARSYAWFVAVEGENTVGIVGAIAFSQPPARDLIAMWTHGDSRGTGVAEQLVSAVIEWAQADGGRELLLWVADGNYRARAFYERLGFKPTGERKQLRSNPAVGEDQLRLLL